MSSEVARGTHPHEYLEEGQAHRRPPRAGRVKENLGEITGNDRLRSEGKVDQVKARVKMSGERVKDALRGR
ncbi:hypothetical protein MMAD_45660 [Mycolicibacterium madagascariense]|uniref:CsbD-like domain-containing protein n=1 Tax=Mycolicibacterium madagascariense TaxID=212765 RepID=A0A7I7XM17_9MYCO|nr:CsbD family protein [Mycolicibacterium madagascariense]MCV7012590.1 CsbD family protein [Mycolicibacterium madagascariense]BBZ30271.1 hypothetical protein MMAD_45660 [Mycolicibacterium madagascariense]